jgi:hypothetical protein
MPHILPTSVPKSRQGRICWGDASIEKRFSYLRPDQCATITNWVEQA